jgi:hypothetical protein
MKLDFLSRVTQRPQLSSGTRNIPYYYVHSSINRSATVSQPLFLRAHPPLLVFNTCRNFVLVLEDTEEMLDVLIQTLFIRPVTSM